MDEHKIYTYMANCKLCVYILLHYFGWLALGIQQVGAADTGTSDEQKSLQQALFLVELLKSEYAKVLRENKEMLRNKELWKEDSMTCATTNKKEEAERPLNTHLLRRKQPDYIPARKYYYNNDYGNADGWRRFQYEDIFGPQPSSNDVHRTTTSPTDTIIEALSSNSTHNQPSTSTSNAKNIFSISSTSSLVTTPKMTTTFDTKTAKSTTMTTINTFKTLITPQTTLTDATQKMKLSFSIKMPNATSNTLTMNTKKHYSTHMSTSTTPQVMKVEKITSHTKTSGQKLFEKSSRIPKKIELELSQAAAELESELANFERPFNVLKGKLQKLSTSWRPSTRIHLASSTRYPIPLPENHAFCYTNPKSALCRTFI